MPHELYRLIARYRWLQQELSDQSGAGNAANANVLANSLEEVFLGIVKFEAEDPNISYCQIEFLLSMLAEGTRDRKLRRMLRDEALAHVKRLAERAAPVASPASARTGGG